MEGVFSGDPYRQFIFYRTYSRWNDELGRRETWEEAVRRYMNFLSDKVGDKLGMDEFMEINEAILNQEVMPSMRLLWAAGPAVEKENATAYNCSYLAPTCLQDFGEVLYLLTCGCGVGYSVEKKIVDQLPTIERQTGEEPTVYVVEDSREGWADALVHGMTEWYGGRDVMFDVRKIRPKGSRLKTMGGRASGPEPLVGLLKFTRDIILESQGRQLRPIQVHDILCKIGDIVVAGGVRRSSEISLSDLDDPEMRDAKNGQFYLLEPQRSMANNSAVYNEKPTQAQFMEEWSNLMKSGSGERGIFNRGGLKTQMPARREFQETMGTNPCGEISLRSKQFCNLTEVVARENDTKVSLIRKVRIATILGTFQSSLTNFPYLSPEWKKNCEEEALLGVSITGQFDCPAILENAELLRELKEEAIKTNENYAERFGINKSTSITTVKPSGTVSQLVDASSGMHPRFAQYYIRRVRISSHDPLFKMLRDQGVPYQPEVGQNKNVTTYVFEFPIASPQNSKVVNGDYKALDQLEHWKLIKENYTEHNPSNTIYIEEDEWLSVANWLWENWDIIGGLSFLPKTNHIYMLAPYEKITQEQYKELRQQMPEIDFSQLSKYELEDNTEGAKTLACAGNVCEIV